MQAYFSVYFYIKLYQNLKSVQLFYIFLIVYFTSVILLLLFTSLFLSLEMVLWQHSVHSHCCATLTMLHHKSRY